MIETYAPVFIVEIGGKKISSDISQKIERFSYEDNEGKMDELKITISGGSLDFVDNPQLREGKEIRVRWGYLGNLSDMRVCTIKELSYSFNEDGTVRIDITAFDKRHKLTGRSARTCWKNKKVENIVKDIAKKHNLTPFVSIQEDVTREFVSQGGKNDMVFLAELARDTGCAVWVTNNELHFKPNTVGEPVRKFRWREDRDGYLKSFKITVKAEKGKGTGRGTEMSGVDPLTKKPIKETTATKTSGSSDSSECFSLENREKVSSANPEGAALPENQVSNETPLQTKADEAGRVIPTPAPTKALARQDGKGKVKTASMKSIEASATTIGLPYLKAKDTVIIENVGRKFSGKWRIKKVTHNISRSGYTCDLSLCRSNYGGTGKKSGAAPKSQGSASAAKAAGAAGGKKAGPPFMTANLNTRETKWN